MAVKVEILKVTGGKKWILKVKSKSKLIFENILIK